MAAVGESNGAGTQHKNALAEADGRLPIGSLVAGSTPCRVNPVFEVQWEEV
jgi:hypothetical protein